MRRLAQCDRAVLLIVQRFNKFKQSTPFRISSGPDENRTHHSLLAREKRLPWYMPAHIKNKLLLISGRLSSLQPVVQLHNTISTHLLRRLAIPNSFIFV